MTGQRAMIVAAGHVARDAILADRRAAKIVVDRKIVAPAAIDLDNFAAEIARNVAAVEKNFVAMNPANIARRNHCRTSW